MQDAATALGSISISIPAPVVDPDPGAISTEDSKQASEGGGDVPATSTSTSTSSSSQSINVCDLVCHTLQVRMIMIEIMTRIMIIMTMILSSWLQYFWIIHRISNYFLWVNFVV